MLFERNCPGCGQPARTVCEPCTRLFVRAGSVEVAGTEWAQAALVYNDLVAALILAGKNRGRRDVLRHLARVLVPAVPDEAQMITWVPANNKSKRSRGYDQGKILAKAIATSVDLPARQLLKRHSGPSQIGQNRSGRLSGPNLTSAPVDSLNIVLVDDVITTGASLATATRALNNSGAQKVWALTLAAVP